MFDAQGRLRNWWTPADFAHFEEAGARLAAQYDAYQPFPDLHVNGKLTLSENIADVAGIAAAHDGWRTSLGRAPRHRRSSASAASSSSSSPTPRTGGARSASRRCARPLITDGHAPGALPRVHRPQLDPWYSAFGVKHGQALYLAPEARVRVW